MTNPVKRSRTPGLIRGTTPKKPPFAPLTPTQSYLQSKDETSDKMSSFTLTESMVEPPQQSTDVHFPESFCIPISDTGERENRKRTMVKANFIIRLAQLYRLYGSPAHNIEESTRKAAEGLGMQLDIKSFPGFMITTFATQDSNETIFQTTFSGNNLEKLEKIDLIARRCSAGQYNGNNLTDAIADLDRIMMAPDPWALPIVLFMIGVSHGLSAICSFNGGWRDGVLAGSLGMLTGLSILKIEELISPKLAKLNGFFSCVFNSFVVRMVQLHVHPSISFYPSTVSSILCILPGLGITIGAIEMSQSHIVAGTARMVDGFFRTMLIAIGISMGSDIAFHISGKGPEDLVQMNLIALSRWHSAMVFPLLSFSLNFNLNSSPSQFPSQIMTACCGFLIYTCCVQMNFAREMTIVISAFVITLVGHLLTLYNRRPSLITVLSGLLILVPGGMSVQGAAKTLVGGEESGQTGSIIISVITVATSISIGVFVANVLVYPGNTGKLKPLGI